ncbi:MAG: hypothetical protein ABI240_01245 [Sphingomonas sp.]
MSKAWSVKSGKMHRDIPIVSTSQQVDRPGFDLGGSTGETTAGLGLGLGDDSSDTSLGRSLPGRRMQGKLSIPRWRGPDIV